MRKHLPEEIGVKAAGGIRTVDEVLALCEAGVTRIGTGSTAAILDEWQGRLKTAASGAV
jgi:deoxyribose-phosphate aldolase